MRYVIPQRTVRAGIAMALLASSATAQSGADPVTKLKASYEAAIIRTQKEYTDKKDSCRKGYPAALNTKEILFQRAGDLDGVLAIRKEKKRYTREKTVPGEPPPGTDDQVAALQITYHKALRDAETKYNKAILHWTNLYLEKLESLKKSLTVAGKIEQALEAKKEQERVRADPVFTAAQFAMADMKTSAAAPDVRPADTQPAAPAAAPTRCSVCGGNGQCDRCKGTGFSPHSMRGVRTRGKCIRCMGSGKCRTCDGTGWVDAGGRPAEPRATAPPTQARDDEQPADGIAKFVQGLEKLLRSVTPQTVDINTAWYDYKNYQGKVLRSEVRVMGSREGQAMVHAGKTVGEGKGRPVWFPLKPVNAQVAAKFSALRRNTRANITYVIAQDRTRYLLDVQPIAGGEGERQRGEGWRRRDG